MTEVHVDQLESGVVQVSSSFKCSL